MATGRLMVWAAIGAAMWVEVAIGACPTTTGACPTTAGAVRIAGWWSATGATGANGAANGRCAGAKIAFAAALETATKRVKAMMHCFDYIILLYHVNLGYIMDD